MISWKPESCRLNSFFSSSSFTSYFFSSTDLSHLPALQTAIKQVNQWFDLGLQLGVPYHTLDIIKIEMRENVADSKRKMLVAWLQGSGGEPSKQFLVKALRNI